MAATMDGQWAYAVPMDETNGFAPHQATNTMGTRESRTSDYRDSRNSSMARHDDYNILSDSEAMGTRKASIRAGNSSAIRKRSRNTLREKRYEAPEEPVDDSAWIHRDKLAQIEIQEMEEAGIHVRPSSRTASVRPSSRAPSAGPDAKRRSSRSASRSGPGRAVSTDRQPEPVEEDEYGGPEYTTLDDYRRKRVSTIPAADEEDHVFDPTVDSEIRTPEEVAAEQQAARQHTIRPSTSRIPISTASPVPVPQTVVGRDSPLPRSRNGSGAWSGAWDEMQYARRARSASVGSQVVLDDVEGRRTPSRPTSSYIRTPGNENSPPKARVPNKSTPISGARKTSTSNGVSPRPGSSNMTKGRLDSGSATKPRPTSSSGHKRRVSANINPPEGEAPWIASMYKPDPRLPPEEQMLPTHAKRMLQEQWQKEGKTGTAYDRDFNLLNDEQFQQPKPLPSQPQTSPHATPEIAQPGANSSHPTSRSPPLQQPTDPWPLSRNTSDKQSEAGSQRPGTSGGYKITPTIPAPAPIERSSGSVHGARGAVPHKPTPRVPDMDEKYQEEPKKGCCCIIM